MLIRDDDNMEKHDIPLDVLREEEDELVEIPEEEAGRKRVFIYLILAVIAFALCGISFVFGIKMGRNLERKQLVLREEMVRSKQYKIRPLPHPDKAGKEAPPRKVDEKENISTKQIEEYEGEGGSQEFMILQNARKTGKKKTAKREPPDSAIKKVEAAKQEKQSPKDAEKYFTIQVAATGNKEQAEALKEGLAEKGYDAYISTVRVHGKKFYRIRIGKFSSEREAMHAAEELKEKENLKNDLWITGI